MTQALFRTERFDTLPIVVRQREGGAAMLTLQFAALVICGLVIVLGPDQIEDSELAVTAAVVVALVVLVELVRRFRRGTIGDATRIDTNGVQMADKAGGWQEPLEAYEGVVWREEIRSAGLTGGGPRKQRHSFIELRHREDPDRTVQLLHKRGRRGVRAAWEGAAASLGLPAMRELMDGTIMRREPGDLDASLTELLRDGRLELPAEATVAPQGVTRSNGSPPEGRIQRASPIAFYIFLATLGISLVAVAAAVIGGSPLPLIAAPVPLIGYHCWAQSYLLINRDGGDLSLAQKVGAITLARRRLAAEEVEEVWHEPFAAGGPAGAMQSNAPASMRRVRAESDRAAVALGPLPEETAVWLSAFLIELATYSGGRSHGRRP